MKLESKGGVAWAVYQAVIPILHGLSELWQPLLRQEVGGLEVMAGVGFVKGQADERTPEPSQKHIES